ncbi:MAG: hypothetical protein GX892_10920, partial [Thermoanaerobacteraceae bacterium]|nr:hypothetical protein [Thermoanaerobacteraceae bacterium]
FRYFIIITVIVLTGFGYGYLKTLFSIEEPNRNDNLNIIEHDVTQIPEMRLQPGAKLIYTTYYIKCNHEITQEKTIDDKIIGYSKSDLEHLEKDWEIASFTPNEVSLIREINDICDKHYYIGIQDGYVALFQGIPGIKSILIEQTDIIADTLREDDRLILEKGLTINDEQEFLKIREGLTN